MSTFKNRTPISYIPNVPAPSKSVQQANLQAPPQHQKSPAGYTAGYTLIPNTIVAPGAVILTREGQAVRVSLATLKVYEVIKSHIYGQRVSFAISNVTLAADLGRSVRQIQRHVAILEELGWISVQHRAGQTNIFGLTGKAGLEPSPATHDISDRGIRHEQQDTYDTNVRHINHAEKIQEEEDLEQDDCVPEVVPGSRTRGRQFWELALRDGCTPRIRQYAALAQVVGITADNRLVVQVAPYGWDWLGSDEVLLKHALTRLGIADLVVYKSSHPPSELE